MDIPLISPSLIYFIGIVDNLKSLFVTINVIITILWIILLIIFVVTYQEKCKLPTSISKFLRVCPFFAIIFGILSASIPSQKWMVVLAINQQITPKNIEIANNSAKFAYKEIKSEFIEILKNLDEKEHDISKEK